MGQLVSAIRHAWDPEENPQDRVSVQQEEPAEFLVPAHADLRIVRVDGGDGGGGSVARFLRGDVLQLDGVRLHGLSLALVRCRGIGGQTGDRAELRFFLGAIGRARGSVRLRPDVTVCPREPDVHVCVDTDGDEEDSDAPAVRQGVPQCYVFCRNPAPVAGCGTVCVQAERDVCCISLGLVNRILLECVLKRTLERVPVISPGIQGATQSIAICFRLGRL